VISAAKIKTHDRQEANVLSAFASPYTKVYLTPSCGPKQRVSSRTSEEPAKLLDRQPGITYNPAQREGLDRIMPGYSDLAVPIAHDDMLALPNNLETRSGQSTHGILMIDTWYPGHELNRDLDFADILTPSLVFEGGHILADGVSDVLERLLFSIPLGPATR
jgi:hypothetical protein